MLVLLNGNNFRHNLLTNDNAYNNNEINLKRAGYWEVSPIYIDDTDPSYNWAITAATYDWCSGSGTWIDPYVIENITIDAGGSGNCLAISDSIAYFIIRNSKFNNSGSSGLDTAIQLINVDNGTLINNNCSNSFRGIYLLSGSSNNTIIQNILSNTGRDGLYLTNSHDNFVIENYVNNNARHGLVFSGSSKNIIIGNEVNDNFYYGIHLDGCPNNIISSNNVSDNGDSGIALSSTSTNNNTITMNILKQNEIVGMTIFSGSTNNTIYNNTFIDNALDAKDETINNYWNYDSLGNYWSDYSGIDANDDGIGDTPYVSGNIIDYYPIWEDGDDLPPIIKINSPLSDQLNETIAPLYNVEIFDPNLDTMWYTIDGGVTNIIFTVNGTIDQSNWTAHIDGPVTLIFYANDTVGHINSAQVLIYKDTIIPTINIITPSASHIFDESAPDFNVEISDPNLDTMWYTIDGGLTNITFSTNDTIDQNNWTAHIDGSVTLIFYANDTVGHINSAQVLIYKDTIIPTINIITPSASHVSDESAPDFNVEISDPNLDTMWYTIDGGVTNIIFTVNGTIDQSNWTAHIDGPVTLIFYANDTLGHINSAQVLINKDTTSSIINIISPVSDQFTGINSPEFTVEISDLNLDTMWYTIDGGLTNFIFTVNGTIDQSNWTAHIDGSVSIIFYANDTLGHINSAQVTIIKDTTIPVINIISPVPDQFVGANSPEFNVEISDPNLDTMWYTIDGGLTNITFTTNGTIDQDIWTAHIDGSVSIIFYANDTAAKIAFSEILVRKDIEDPIISIVSPTMSEEFEIHPTYEIAIIELYIDMIWYTFDDGTNKVFITELVGIMDQILWNQLPDGYVTIKFYANDTLGNINFDEVIVIKNTPTPAPPTPGIPGYNIFLLLGVISIVAVIIVKKKFNRLD